MKPLGLLLTWGLHSPNRLKATWDVAIVHPKPEFSVAAVVDLFRTGRPFAALMPSDLIHEIPETGIVTQARLDATSKIIFLRADLAWVLEGTRTKGDVVVMNERDSKLATPPATPRLPGDDLGDLLPDIMTETKKEEAFSSLRDGDSIERFGAQFVLRRGLLYETRPATGLRLYIPRSLVDKVIRVIHANSHNHARAPRLLPWLEARFVWQRGDGKLGCREATKRVLNACHACELVRARDQHAHGTLSTQSWTRRMQAIGLDHYKVGFTSTDGYTEVLTIVDMDEKTATTLEAVLTHWIAKFGCPEVIFTDLALVFKSSEAQTFYRLMCISHIVTAPHAHWMLGRV